MNERIQHPDSRVSTRDVLLLAFANLASYGIAAHPALGGDARRARTALRAAILARYPHAIGSYIFWTADREACFAADGTLRTPLVLHHSGPEVARAAQAALKSVGLAATDIADRLQLRVSPNPTTPVDVRLHAYGYS